MHAVSHDSATGIMNHVFPHRRIPVIPSPSRSNTGDKLRAFSTLNARQLHRLVGQHRRSPSAAGPMPYATLTCCHRSTLTPFVRSHSGSSNSPMKVNWLIVTAPEVTKCAPESTK